MSYQVIEIFDSIEGEGIRQGLPATFIRFAGCNLCCSYCDTKYAYDASKATQMTVDEILAKANQTYKRVTLTGGEPLLQENLELLVNALIDKHIQVNIETNGSVDWVKFAVKNYSLNLISRSYLFFTVDYKLPSSGQGHKMLVENFKGCSPCDAIKFVVGSDDDIFTLLNVVASIYNDRKDHERHYQMPHIFLSAVHGKYDSAKLANLILTEPLLKDAKLMVQLHKVVNIK